MTVLCEYAKECSKSCENCEYYYELLSAYQQAEDEYWTQREEELYEQAAEEWEKEQNEQDAYESRYEE